MVAADTLSKPTPLSERAYQALRSAVMTGGYAPGARLKIEVLQGEFGLSSSPLREALNRLVAEGLVTTDERRGFRAAGLSETDLLDLTAARVIAEPGALLASIKRGNDVWESHVVAAHHRLEWVERRVAANEMKRNEDWTARHKEFHMALISACGSDRLLATCSNLFDQAERYRRASANLPTPPRDISTEHRDLMKAALDRDVVNGPELLERHLTRTAEKIASFMHASPQGLLATPQDQPQ
jgi:DNA-binding GntR family transcriptional regulator